jgi:ketosteroid isomerase-like protein
VRASVLLLLAAGPLAAQSSLADAAEQARRAWLAHDVDALVAHSPSLVLQIPGADPSSPLVRAQAAELLKRYFRPAEERAVEVRTVREVEPGRGFVELERRYVVSGTSDERRETVFLGFQFRYGRWVLAELRGGA